MATAKVKSSLKFEAVVILELTESEARALNEMTKYGIKPFIKGYKKLLGSHYIEPHVKGLTSLFETIDDSLASELYKLDEYKKAICAAELNQRSDKCQNARYAKINSMLDTFYRKRA